MYTPLRPSVLEMTQGNAPPQEHSTSQVTMSPIHHHHYGAADKVPLETIISGSMNMTNGPIHVHHHNENGKEKKKRRKGKKKVSYKDDDDDDDNDGDDGEYCNIKEHRDAVKCFNYDTYFLSIFIIYFNLFTFLFWL